MRILLEDLLKLQPLNKAQILAGEKGLKKPIDLFGVLEAPDSFNFVKNNEFLMTTGYMFKDNPKLQYKVIKELYNRGVCALGIKIGRYITEIPKEVLQFCSEHDFPLLYLPSEYGWYDFFSPLLYLMHMEPESNTELLNKMTYLSNKIFSSNNFNQIIKYLYKLLNRPCCIYLNYNNQQMIHQKNFPLNHIPVAHILEKFDNKENYFIMNQIKRIKLEDQSVLVSPIKNNRTCYGYIFLIDEPNLLKLEDLSLFQYFIVCLQIYTSNLLDLNRKFTTKHNKFLLELIHDRSIDKSKLLYEANELNINLHCDYIVSISKGIPFSQYEDINKLYTFIENNINHKYKVLSAFNLDGNYIVFNPLNQRDSLEYMYKNTKSKIIKIKKELEKFFNGHTFSFGIGTYEASIEGIQKSYYKATRAFDSYSKFFDSDFIIDFKNLGIYSILSNPSIKEDIQAFVEHSIYPIIQFDQENNAELLITSKYFFDCHRSFRNCAKAMNLHHNTIRYRLKKIEELCNIDLSSENDLLALELALKLLPFCNRVGDH
ncbi:MAG: PucR family transcriptional regulator ligand-binding domain-containing protein [Marinisporobacter sp.]|nr:PucR family transcriptional regulator ligand-binding domain-containing protein [Marinisporobacter sp.]